MRGEVNVPLLEVSLERILEALECELIEASDAEILQAAQDLGMNPAMRGSAAFIGLKYPTIEKRAALFAEFFGVAIPQDARPRQLRHRKPSRDR